MKMISLMKKGSKKVTNTNLLRQKITESGYKLQYVAEQLSLTYFGFMKKVNNETEFKASEISTLKNLLHLTDEEANAIFFYTESR